jgi:Fe-S-cluster containining protein
MDIEKDLHTIERVAKEKEEENWEFRSFLKQLDIEIEKLDAIVRQVTAEVTSQIDCTECGNCCKRVRPELDKEDITRFAKGLKISVEDLRDKYLIQNEDTGSNQIFNSLPCPFLENNMCMNYECRPKACASYPHLDKDEFVFRVWGVIENYAICPIVFNVYNQLKNEQWHYNDFDGDDFSDFDF